MKTKTEKILLQLQKVVKEASVSFNDLSNAFRKEKQKDIKSIQKRLDNARKLDEIKDYK